MASKLPIVWYKTQIESFMAMLETITPSNMMSKEMKIVMCEAFCTWLLTVNGWPTTMPP